MHSIVNLIEYKSKKSFEVFNQTTELLSIKHLAAEISKQSNKIGCKSNLNFIKNPRVEKEEHQMKMENEKFLKLLKKKPDYFKNEILDILKSLKRYKRTIMKNKKSFL